MSLKHHPPFHTGRETEHDLFGSECGDYATNGNTNRMGGHNHGTCDKQTQTEANRKKKTHPTPAQPASKQPKYGHNGDNDGDNGNNWPSSSSMSVKDDSFESILIQRKITN